MPVKVYDEKDCVKKHAKEIAAYGKRALIVTGKGSSQANGSLDDVTEALEQENVEYQVFFDVEENPSTETIFTAADACRSSDIDMVIGIGGGSPLDAAKAIALALKHPEADLEYLYDAAKDPSALPVIAVPTTCGTGSEVTGISVLTRHDLKTKMSMVHKVFPVLALVDGKYIKSAPQSLLINTSMDALAHLYESALNAKVDDYSRMTVAAGLKCWAKTKDVLTGERTRTEEDLSLLMRSSAFAGMSIAQYGTAIPHALSYVLTYDLAFPHGKAVSYFLPGFLSQAPAEESSELLQLSGFRDLKEFCSFREKIFGSMEVPEAALQRTYEMVVNSPKMKGTSFPMDPDILHRIVFEKV